MHLELCLAIRFSIDLVIIQMNNQSQGDRPSRKSARQRVPNAFYTQAINQLKKAPKPFREPLPKTQSKKPKIYHESQVNSEVQDQLQDDNSGVYDQKNWYPCKLPKTGQLLKVQFVLNNFQEPIVEKKKEEPPKIPKKEQAAFDLLSLFQKAIEKVNDLDVEKPIENEPLPKPSLAKIYNKPARVTRKQDSEGSITAVHCSAQRIVFLQSILGEVQLQMKEHETLTEQFDEVLIDELREKALNSQVFAQLQLFQSEE